ncbi:hypothetical protein [Streptomyces sp. NPDC127100]
MISATSAQATTQEATAGSGEALATLTRTLHEICIAHMAGAPVVRSQERALSCWRDALAAKVNVTGPRFLRAAEMEAKAACLVAQFHGDLGQDDLAVRWYARALAVAPISDQRAWIHSCSAWVPMFNGNGEGVVRAAQKALEFATISNPMQEAFAFNQLARGHAIRGDHDRALEALISADKSFHRYGYYGKNTSPSLDGFSRWQHAAYAANTYSMLGDVHHARANLAVMAEAPFVSGINHMLHKTSEAVCLVHEGEPDGAVEMVQQCIDSLDPEDAATQPVRGRAQMFVDQMPTNLRKARAVRDFREYLAAA